MAGFREFEVDQHRVRVEVETWIESEGRLEPADLTIVVTALTDGDPQAIRTDFLRRIQLGRVLKGLRRMRRIELAAIDSQDRGETVHIGLGHPSRRKGGGHPPEHWLRIGQLYEEAANQHPPESPRKYIATVMAVPVGTAAAWIQRATDRGYIPTDRLED